ncbi:MAG TPA: hypothetical protein VJS66_08345 [Burkholderiales bacterium]|nr:hypothetical protein [Burkholderiales bacterium]
MNRRYVLFGAAVAILVLLNAAQWLAPTNGKTARLPATAATGFRPEDFRLKIGFEPPRPGTTRDLFRVWLPPAPVQIKKVEQPPTPPPKTPEQLAEEAARAELIQLKLVGVVFRGDKGQAFVVKGDQTFLVHSGEKVGERFVVQSVTTDSVTLKDPKTNVTGQIPVSGK